MGTLDLCFEMPETIQKESFQFHHPELRTFKMCLEFPVLAALSANYLTNIGRFRAGRGNHDELQEDKSSATAQRRGDPSPHQQ
jgi:hypothetical protein